MWGENVSPYATVRGRLLPVATIADRIRQMIEELGTNASALSVLAMGATNRSYLNAYLRAVDGSKQDDGGITVTVLRKLSAVTGYSVAWLASGDGSPRTEAGARRSLAIELAREAGVADEAIEQILRDYADDPARPTAYWLDKFRLRHAVILHRMAPHLAPDPLGREGTQTGEVAIVEGHPSRPSPLPATPAAGTQRVPQHAPTSSKRRPRLPPEGEGGGERRGGG